MSSSGKIQIDQLTGSENYIDWALRIKAVLVKDDLLDPIIDEKPQNNSKNLKALAIIQLFCAKGPLLYIKACSTAYKAWFTLEELYNPKGFTTEFLTLKEFFDCKLENFQTMEEYIHQIKTLLDDLSSKNIEVASQIKISWILYNLGEEWKFFTQNIIQAFRKDSNAYTFDSLCANLIDEAKGKTADQIYAVKMKNKYKKNNDLFCTNCKKTNHNISNCFFLYKEKRPSNWKSPDNKIIKDKKYSKNIKKEEKKKQELLNAIIEANSDEESDSEMNIDEEINILQENTQENISFNEELFENIDIEVNNQNPIHNIYTYTDNKTTDINNNLLQRKNEENTNYFQKHVEFIIDTGATVSAITNLSYFQNYKNTQKSVQWGKAKNIKIEYEGTVVFRFNTKSIYILKNVLYIPELGINILSTNNIKNNICIFTDKKCLIYNNKRKLICSAYKKNKLYKTEVDNSLQKG